MKQFKFKSYIFNNLLPRKFKEEDTYKDNEGRGILERFVDVCAEYLDEEVMPNIDNLLDIIDIDKAPEECVNLIWEYFGYIPYGYGVIYANKGYTKQDLSENLARRFPVADYRNLLRYVISLYKIRCTDNFYKILGRFYDINIILSEPVPMDGNYVTYDKPNVTYDDHYDYDRSDDCLKCMEITATIEIPLAIYNYLSEDNIRMQNAKNSLKALLNKYTPINVALFNDETLIMKPITPELIFYYKDDNNSN